MSVIVVTDSGAHIPASLRERWNIRQVPLHILHGDVDYRDGVDEISDDDLFSGNTTTSGATLSDLTEIYEQAAADSHGDGVLGVHMSRKLSGTWNSARLTAENIGGVRVVDSRTVGFGAGLAAIAAAQVAAAGGDVDAAYETAVRVGSTGEQAFVAAHLDQLRASGRIGLRAALLGTALSIKPVLRVVDGGLVLKEKQRTMSKAVDKMVDDIVAAVKGRKVVVGVQHCQAPEEAADIQARLRDRLTVVDSIIIPLSPVLACHVGPGAVGAAVAPDVGAFDLP